MTNSRLSIDVTFSIHGKSSINCQSTNEKRTFIIEHKNSQWVNGAQEQQPMRDSGRRAGSGTRKFLRRNSQWPEERLRCCRVLWNLQTSCAPSLPVSFSLDESEIGWISLDSSEPPVKLSRRKDWLFRMTCPCVV